MRNDNSSEWLKLVDDESGVYNRIYLIHYLTEVYARARRYGMSASCVLFQTKWWQGAEDLGLEKGAPPDAVREIAMFLMLSVREGDILGRWARDEFLLVATGTDRKGLNTLTQIIAEKALEFRFENLPDLGVSVRAGVAGIPDDNEKIRHAEAMPIVARERLAPLFTAGQFRGCSPGCR